MQSIYICYMYSKWKKIRALDKDDPLENKGQMHSSFKEFERKIKYKLENFDTKKIAKKLIYKIEPILPTLSDKYGLTLPEST